MIGEELACDNDDFTLHSRAIGIRSNLLKDWNVFEFALVWNWAYELLAQGGKPSLCNCCHFVKMDGMRGFNERGGGDNGKGREILYRRGGERRLACQLEAIAEAGRSLGRNLGRCLGPVQPINGQRELTKQSRRILQPTICSVYQGQNGDGEVGPEIVSSLSSISRQSERDAAEEYSRNKCKYHLQNCCEKFFQ